MKTAIRYYTKSGNTQKLAAAIGNALELTPETIAVPLSEKADILLLGCSYYAFDMDPEVKKFLADNKEKIGVVVPFGTSAMMKSMAKPMKKVTEPLGIAVSDMEFHCRGSFGPANKGRPNADDLDDARLFALQVVKKETV